MAVLLADGRLILVDAATGLTLAEHGYDPPYRSWPASQWLGRGSGGEIFALMPGPAGATVVALNAQTLRTRLVTTLSSAASGALAVGPRTGRLFVFWGSGAHVLVLDPETGEERGRLDAPLDQSRHWSVYNGAVSSDERRLYISYHDDATGIDWFDLTDQGWRRCAIDTGPGNGCVVSHGSVVVSGDAVLAATGDSELIEIDNRGATTRRIDTGLYNNHLMNFAVDERLRTVFATGPCDYAGGFTATDWPKSGKPAAPRVFVASGDYTVCGDRVASAPDGSWLVIAARAIVRHTRIPDRPAMLFVADARSGAILRRIELTSDPIDVVVVR